MSVAVPETIAARQAPAPRVSLRIVPTPVEPRSGYHPSGGARPLALGASIAVVAAITAGIALSGIGSAPAPAPRPLTIVSMELLPPDPPPPAAPEPAQPQAATPPPIQVPVPEVQVPVPPSPVAVTTLDVPVPPVSTSVATMPAAPAPVAAAAPAPSSADAGDLSTRMLVATPPSYPEECRRRREQGTVKLAVLVGLDGRVAHASVAGSSGSDRLDRAALGAVRRWRWSPLMRDGAAVMVRGFVTIPFILRT